MVTGVDLVQAQIRVADASAHDPQTRVSGARRFALAGLAIQARITTAIQQESARYVRITTYRSPPGSASA